MKVLCDELALFGKYELVTGHIAKLPGSVSGIYEAVLQRVENEYSREAVTRLVLSKSLGNNW